MSIHFILSNFVLSVDHFGTNSEVVNIHVKGCMFIVACILCCFGFGWCCCELSFPGRRPCICFMSL